MNEKVDLGELVRVEIRDELKPVIMEKLASFAKHPCGNEFALHISFDPDGVLKLSHLMHIEDLIGASIFAVPPSAVSECQ